MAGLNPNGSDLGLRYIYRFDQFTLSKYEELLQTAMKNYNFIFFEELESTKDKSIILRHDLEFSVPLAVRMAEIEQSLGIKSTTFVNMHSEYYNVFESATFNAIKYLISTGNRIGVHIDAHFYNIQTEYELEKHLIREKKLLEDFFSIRIHTFSFHNTNTSLLGFKKDEYAGLINVYSDKYFKRIGYCADSTGYWRYENLFDRVSLASDHVLQILIHDGMWQSEVLPPRRRIYKVIDDKAEALKNFYDTTLIKFGASNIDWDSVL